MMNHRIVSSGSPCSGAAPSTVSTASACSLSFGVHGLGGGHGLFQLGVLDIILVCHHGTAYLAIVSKILVMVLPTT